MKFGGWIWGTILNGQKTTIYEWYQEISSSILKTGREETTQPHSSSEAMRSIRSTRLWLYPASSLSLTFQTNTLLSNPPLIKTSFSRIVPAQSVLTFVPGSCAFNEATTFPD